MKRIGLVLTLVLFVTSIGMASAQDAVTLKLWAHQESNFNAGTQALIDAYEAANPNVTIEMETFEYSLYIQTLQTALPAGDEADILALFGSWVCSYSDRLAPMPESLEINRDDFFSATLGGYICDDTLYGLPQEFNLEYGGVLVNQSMFEAAGRTYPPNWQTWDEMIVDAEALTVRGDDGAMTVAGFHFTNADAIAHFFMSGILQRGGSYVTEDGSYNLDTEESRATLQQMMDLVAAGVVDPVLFNDSANWGGSAFFANQSAIVLIGPWATGISADYPDFGAFGYARMPSVGADPAFVADSGWGLTASAASPNRAIAWDFIAFAAREQANALAWNLQSKTIPALRSIVADDAARTELLRVQPWLESILPNLEFGRFLGSLPDRDLLYYDIIYPTVLDMLQGVLSVEEAAQIINEDANAGA
jgi:multiple sugar transport system substrate-binding protein